MAKLSEFSTKELGLALALSPFFEGGGDGARVEKNKKSQGIG